MMKIYDEANVAKWECESFREYESNWKLETRPRANMHILLTGRCNSLRDKNERKTGVFTNIKSRRKWTI